MDSIVNLSTADFTTPVVSLALAKANANIQYTEQDSLLELLLHASIQDAEEYTGTVIQQRNVVIGLSEFEQLVQLPVAPLTAITSILYVNKEGADVPLESDDYEILSEGYALRFKLQEFPELQADNPYPITITGKAGYTESTVPKSIQSAILVKFGHKELYREDAPVNGNDRSFNAALRPYKVW